MTWLGIFAHDEHSDASIGDGYIIALQRGLHAAYVTRSDGTRPSLYEARGVVTRAEVGEIDHGAASAELQPLTLSVQMQGADEAQPIAGVWRVVRLAEFPDVPALAAQRQTA